MKDLFNQLDKLPPALSEVIDKHSEDFENTYEACEAFLSDCEAIGYTFDYYLDAKPFGLRPKGVELKELEEYSNL